jgi:type IX secretion system PorP/SprF family membrane protein
MFLICLNAIGQQKPPYSQYMFNLFLINPAAAGSEGFTSFNLTAREQWVGLANTPKTHSLSVQTRVLKNSFIAKALKLRKKFGSRSKSGRVGVGAYIYNDFSGPISRTGMQYTYAYHIPLRQSQLSFGLALENYYYKINKDWLSQNLLNEDPILNSKLHRFTIDGNFGVQFTTPFLYSGISVSDIFQSNLNFGDSISRTLQVGRHYWITGGYKIELNRFFMLEPSTLMSHYLSVPSIYEMQGVSKIVSCS